MCGADHTCCVVRGRPRLRSVHRERAGRVIEPRKGQTRSRRCSNSGRPHYRSCNGLGRGSAGVEERGMYARVVQEPGISRFLHRQDAARAPRQKWPRPPGNRPARGSEGGRSGGSAERRKRSEARGEARSRSRLIVRAGQRPDRVGSSPTGARVRGVISKRGGNASLAGVC